MSKSDSKELFNQLYDENINKVYRFVFLKVNSQETAQDICSEAFLRCWEVLKKNNKEIDNPKAFLYQITKNLIIDHYREKGKSQTVSVDVLPIADTNYDLEKEMADSSDIDMIRTSLNGLKEEYQDVVVWHYIEDYTIPEISQMMDKSEGAVRVMLHRALKALKNKINNIEEA